MSEFKGILFEYWPYTENARRSSLFLVSPQWTVFKFWGPRAMFAPFVVSYAQGGQMAPCALRPAGAEAVFAISPSA